MLIKDQQQFDKFIDILPLLSNDEIYFISLSARNKYLTKEEREHYGLSGTEMFGREVALTKEKLSTYTIKKLEATLSYKTTRNKLPIPEKSLVCYMNVNPSSMVKAYMQFQKEMNNQVADLMLALQRDKQPNYSFINLQNRELLNCIQKSPSRKYFLDIDCDTKDSYILHYIWEELRKYKIVFHIVETKGGYHFLIHTDSLGKVSGKEFNVGTLTMNASKLAEEALGSPVEIMINANGMIPIPGTMQSDHLVKFVLY